MNESIKIYCHLWGNTTTFSISPILKAWSFTMPRVQKPVATWRYSTKVVELSPAWQELPYYYGGMGCAAFGRISPVTGKPEIASVSGNRHCLGLDQDGVLIGELWDEGLSQWVAYPVTQGWESIAE